MELRFRGGPHRGRPKAKDDGDRGRAHQGVPDDRGRAEHHGRGRGCHPSVLVRGTGGRAGLHPLGQNGPEFVATAVKRWLEASGVGTLYIEPGSPWENAYGESFNGRFGDELLKREEFASLLEAKVLVEGYREHYNRRRPHSALGYRTPSEFATICRTALTAADEGIVDEEREKELEFIPVLS